MKLSAKSCILACDALEASEGFGETNQVYLTRVISSSGSIPVYWGAPNIHEFAPGADSYIDVRAYTSPEELADRLVALDGDEGDDGYRKYQR